MLTTASASSTTAFIYGVSDDQKTISLDGSNTNEITKDTVVLYVDTKDHKGYANGEIQEADDFGSGKIANVMYKLDGTAKDSDVALLIVDVKNNLHGAFKYNFARTQTQLISTWREQGGCYY